MSQKKPSHDPGKGSYQSSRICTKPTSEIRLKKSAKYKRLLHNPVIVIHGFLGSHLKDTATQEDVWGTFTGLDALRGYSDKELQALSHPMAYGKPLKELRDNVYPSELLNTFDISLFGIHFHRDAYSKMIDILISAGYNQEGAPLPEGEEIYSLFVFYYDWRRDLPENAAKLHEFILEKRAYIQKMHKELDNTNNYDVQFDILAHSMGGLLSRYYLRYGNQDLPASNPLAKLNWYGTKYIDKLVLIGTPNYGYLDAYLELVNGLQIAGHAPFYPPAVVGTFPTYYQMMPPTNTKSVVYEDNPSGKPINIFDPKIWLDMKWGLADPKQDKILKILLPEISDPLERHRTAVDHLKKCLKRAKQFNKAMQVYKKPPNKLTLILFLGDAIETNRVASVNKETNNLKVISSEIGDGKIPVSSARMDIPKGIDHTIQHDLRISGDYRADLRQNNKVNSQKIDRFENKTQRKKWDAIIHLSAAHMGITASPDFENNLLYYLLEAPPESSGRQAITPSS